MKMRAARRHRRVRDDDRGSNAAAAIDRAAGGR